MGIAILENKSLVIIGGTTGLGLSAAQAFVDAGARVVVTGRNPENAGKAQEVLGSSAQVLISDATEPQSAAQAIAAAKGAFGRFDGLYHVAGGSGRKWGDGPLHDISDAGWRMTLELNLSSVFYSNRAAIRQFLADGQGGAILNMSSVLAFSPSTFFFNTHAYASAKAAIIGLSKSAAAYYAKQNIRVNVIAPALVETPMSARAQSNPAILDFIRTKQPLHQGGMGAPSDLDGAAVFLFSDASRYLTGQVLAVDGGWSVSEGQASASGAELK